MSGTPHFRSVAERFRRQRLSVERKGMTMMSFDGTTARQNSRTLMVTFAVGMGVGAILAYAVLASWGVDFSGKAAAPAQENPVTIAADVADAADDASAHPAPLSVSAAADLGGLWPARHLFIGLSGLELTPEETDMLRVFKPGGVILAEHNMASAAQTEGLVDAIKLTEGLGSELGDLPIVAVAQEGGGINPLGIADAPAFEVLGKTNDAGKAAEFGRGCAAAAAGRGIGLLLGPVLDVYQPGVTPAGLRPRLLGEDRQVVWRLGLAFIEGVRAGGALPAAKWLPGIGAGLADEDNQTALRRLAERIFPLSKAVSADLPAMLVAHTPVPAISPETPALPASMSPKLLDALVRQSWRYRGVLIADDVTGAAALRHPDDAAAPAAFPSPENAAADAIAAGCDAAILAKTDWTSLERACVEIAYRFRPGALDAAQLQAAAGRLGELQQRLGAKPAIAAAAAPEPGVASPVSQEPPAEAEPAEVVEPSAKTVATGPEEIPESEPTPEEPPQAAHEIAVPAPEPISLAEETPAAARPDESQGTPEMPPASDAEAAPIPEKNDAASVPAPSAAPLAGPPPGTRAIKHLIVQGDTLASISRRYGVKVSELHAWNGLKDAGIKFGGELTVYVKDADVAPPPASGSSSLSTSPEANTAPLAAASGESFGTYVVAPKDSLGRIAGQFGTTQAHLMELNGIEDPDLIKAGQKLKVPARP